MFIWKEGDGSKNGGNIGRLILKKEKKTKKDGTMERTYDRHYERRNTQDG